MNQNKTAQRRVYTAVEVRGYRRDLIPVQFAAYRLMRLYQELFTARQRNLA